MVRPSAGSRAQLRAGVRGVTPCGFTPAPDTPQGPVLVASVVNGGALVSPFLLASEFVSTSKEKISKYVSVSRGFIGVRS